MDFRVNLKMKKPTFCCCFTCVVFIELNFGCISVNKENLGRFVGKVRDGGFYEMGMILVMRG